MSPKTNPSPKTQFHEVPQFVTQHRNMMEQPAFQRGLNYAMLQYQANLARQTNNANDAIKFGLCLLGAQEFCEVLRTLSETATVTPVREVDNLNHKA